MGGDFGCYLAVVPTFVVGVAAMIAALVIIVNTPVPAKTIGDFFIKPGEQLTRCSSKRAFVDFSSPRISVYESPYGSPGILSGVYRPIQLREKGSVKLGYFKSFKHFFTEGTVLEITGTTGSSTAHLTVLEGVENYNNFVNDYYYTTVYSGREKEVNAVIHIEHSEDYYFLVRSTIKSLDYDLNITGRRMLYDTSNLKNACNEHEHFGNCIVNDNESADFCLVIDYRGNTSDFPERVEIYQTSTPRGLDDGSQISFSSSEASISSSESHKSSSSGSHESSSSVTFISSSEMSNSSSEESISSSVSRSSSSQISGSDYSESREGADGSSSDSLDDGIILAIVCIVGGCGILITGLVAAFVSYMRVFRSSYGYNDSDNNGSSSSSSSSSSSDEDDDERGAKMDTFGSKYDPEVGDSGYKGSYMSPSDIPSNIVGAPGGASYPVAPAPVSAYPPPGGAAYPVAPAPGGDYPSAPAPGY